MGNYQLHREQVISRPIESVFAFFADARNLERITPPWLKFSILTPAPIEMRSGAIIEYRIGWGPVLLRWRTEILDWNPPHHFIDVQRRGPYRLWHHAHRFEAVDGGTRMSDIVEYALPLGPLGRMMHAMCVRRDLERIFDYRRNIIEQVFS